ncbi:ankyrin repeat domain-containing protein [Candidatus Avelusimicrobium alvi]|uniref:ankyrin repeat domain-containing protein n=1 Tax=Candidatus Avelusimicrobium alvi TaxID=3416221 RepID=UPI003D120C89
MLPKKKNSTRITVPSEKKLPEAFSVLTKKPLVTLAVVAAVPVLVMLAFTFKSGYTPGAKGGKFDKIVVVKTPTEIADEATSALQKNDIQTFLDVLNNQARNDVNIVNSKGDPLIVAAATLGNLEAVQQLILSGADVNKVNAFNRDTALLRSLYGDHPEITRLLVYSGADINATNNYNHSPMFLALEKQKAEFIDLFLSSGVREGLSADYLFRASAKKNPMGVLAMLKGGVDPNVKNEKGNTPLIISASLGDIPSVQSLMAYRADVNAANNDGNTALIYAARYNHPKVISELLKPQTMQAPLDVNMQNNLGQTALYWGAAKGYEEVVRRLLAADADPTIAAKDGLVPYRIAEKNKRGQILQWFNKDPIEVKNSVIEQDNAALIAQAKAEGRELPAMSGQKAKPVTEDDIFTAAANGNEELAKKVLASNKAAVFKKNKAGETPLLVAVENGQIAMVDLLWDNAARLFEAAPNKGNVFHIAVENQDMDMLKHLVTLARQEGRLAMMLEYKAQKPGVSLTLSTPIGFAAQACNKEIYDYLISIGAKPGTITTKPNALGYQTPADVMQQCKTKPAQAKKLTPKR